MASDDFQSDLNARRAELLLFCGALGLAGSLAPIVMNAAASFVAQHDFVADTISDLGRGPHSWIMDTGFYIGAAGLIALAIGAAHVHLGGMRWSIGIFILPLLALVTVLIGVWDQFGNGEDLSVHTRLTFLLGPLYLLGPLCMAPSAARVMPNAKLLFYGAALLWAVLATWFKLAPDEIDGLIEKLAVLSTLLWTVPLSLILLQLARDPS